MQTKAPSRLSNLFKRQPLAALHKQALHHIILHAQQKYKNILTIIAHGSIGINDTHPFSDIDAAIIIDSSRKTTKQEFLIYNDIVLSLMFYDLNSFVRINVNDPFVGMMDRISINKAKVIFDPNHNWLDIAKTTLAMQNLPTLYPQIIEKLWYLCIIYLGKIISTLADNNLMYASECCITLAKHSAFIILLLNKETFVGNRHLYKQAIQCQIKPKNFQKNLKVLLSNDTKTSLAKAALNALILCKDLQNILVNHPEYKRINSVAVSFQRYEHVLHQYLELN